MKKLLVFMLALCAMSGLAQAQDVVGDWQGSLNLKGGVLRMVVKVTKAESGSLRAMLYNADRATPPIGTSSVTLMGNTFRFSADLMGVTYEGKLSADGKTILGEWMQGGGSTPLEFVRATPETAWKIPAPAPKSSD
jgi:hypothetical protein